MQQFSSLRHELPALARDSHSHLFYGGILFSREVDIGVVGKSKGVLSTSSGQSKVLSSSDTDCVHGDWNRMEPLCALMDGWWKLSCCQLALWSLSDCLASYR